MNISDLKPCAVCALEGYPYDPKTCQTCPNAPVENVEKESKPMKRTWKDKLTSRKFWAAVIGVVISVMVLFGYNEDEMNKAVALVAACGTLAAYIVGEGMTDKAAASASSLEIALKALQDSYKPAIPIDNAVCLTGKGESNDGKREG